MSSVEPRPRARLAALARTCREPWARVVIVLVALLGAAALGGLRVNVSRSYPVGLYRVVGDAASVQRGSVVVVCLPVEWARFAFQRGILGSGHCEGGTYGLGKMVLAVGGDIVEVQPEGIAVNGLPIPNSQPRERDSRGRALPHHSWGIYQIGEGEMWLYSPYHRAAFDSRYFGPVHVARVRSIIVPVWTD